MKDVKCEFCNKEHAGTYGSGRFCCISCARSYSSNQHRVETNEKISKTLKKKHSYKYKKVLKQKTPELKTNITHCLTENELCALAKEKGLDIDSLKPIKGFSNYFASKEGDIYNYNLEKIKPFKSSGYLQLKLKNDNGQSQVKGVHQFVALAFLPNYGPGYVVHHIDENKHNNSLINLQIMSVTEHCRYHAKKTFNSNIPNHGGWNKGMKMSEKFRQHCREGAKKRWGSK